MSVDYHKFFSDFWNVPHYPMDMTDEEELDYLLAFSWIGLTPTSFPVMTEWNINNTPIGPELIISFYGEAEDFAQEYPQLRNLKGFQLIELKYPLKAAAGEQLKFVPEAIRYMKNPRLFEILLQETNPEALDEFANLMREFQKPIIYTFFLVKYLEKLTRNIPILKNPVKRQIFMMSLPKDIIGLTRRLKRNPGALADLQNMFQLNNDQALLATIELASIAELDTLEGILNRHKYV